ncbi:chromate transporter [Paenibacillus sp. UNC217MF]|uniref:chromate transporter n=1 Tax=Paenibacillus sp. UNC217MF TaxID=1449062 RepID=UPI00048EBEA1|nr:chromate transporter [Paenibacillus sp. UNC217MF]
MNQHDLRPAQRIKKRTLLLQLFLTFSQIGPTTFGGGYAILPVIEREIAEKRKWLEADDMGEITALAGAAPGGIGVNVAALVGYRIAGLSGLAAAVIGISLPTIAIMLLLCAGAAGLRDQPYVQAALFGIKPAIVALIVYAAVRLGTRTLTNVFTWTITLTTLALLFWTSLHPVIMLAIGAAAGLVLNWITRSSFMGDHPHDRSKPPRTSNSATRSRQAKQHNNRAV